jgi:hypothetical protein
MYIKLISDVPTLYTVEQLRRDNPQVSFPETIPETVLINYSVFPLTATEQPQVDYTQNVTEGTPVQIAGAWTQVWDVTAATPEQITERTATQAGVVRKQRNRLLADSDWTQLPDAPVDASAWASYRQALRDVTSQTGFPWSVTWPEPPA